MRYINRLIITFLFVLIFSLTVSAQITFEGNSYVKTSSATTYKVNYTISQDLEFDGQVKTSIGTHMGKYLYSKY